MKHINNIPIIALIVVVVLLVYSIGYTATTNDILEYFSIPFYALINISIAIFFAYFLTQYKNDIRKKKEIAEGLIGKIIVDLSNKKMYCIDSQEDLNHVRITQRSIKNRLDMLKVYENEFNIKNDMEYIIQTFDTYWQTISNHISDLEHLKKSQDELFNFITNSTNRLEKIITNLY